MQNGGNHDKAATRTARARPPRRPRTPPFYASSGAYPWYFPTHVLPWIPPSQGGYTPSGGYTPFGAPGFYISGQDAIRYETRTSSTEPFNPYAVPHQIHYQPQASYVPHHGGEDNQPFRRFLEHLTNSVANPYDGGSIFARLSAGPDPQPVPPHDPPPLTQPPPPAWPSTRQGSVFQRLRAQPEEDDSDDSRKAMPMNLEQPITSHDRDLYSRLQPVEDDNTPSQDTSTNVFMRLQHSSHSELVNSTVDTHVDNGVFSRIQPASVSDVRQLLSTSTKPGAHADHTIHEPTTVASTTTNTAPASTPSISNADTSVQSGNVFSRLDTDLGQGTQPIHVPPKHSIFCRLQSIPPNHPTKEVPSSTEIPVSTNVRSNVFARLQSTPPDHISKEVSSSTELPVLTNTRSNVFARLQSTPPDPAPNEVKAPAAASILNPNSGVFARLHNPQSEPSPELTSSAVTVSNATKKSSAHSSVFDRLLLGGEAKSSQSEASLQNQNALISSGGESVFARIQQPPSASCTGSTALSANANVSKPVQQVSTSAAATITHKSTSSVGSLAAKTTLLSGDASLPLASTSGPSTKSKQLPPAEKTPSSAENMCKEKVPDVPVLTATIKQPQPTRITGQTTMSSTGSMVPGEAVPSSAAPSVVPMASASAPAIASSKPSVVSISAKATLSSAENRAPEVPALPETANRQQPTKTHIEGTAGQAGMSSAKVKEPGQAVSSRAAPSVVPLVPASAAAKVTADASANKQSFDHGSSKDMDCDKDNKQREREKERSGSQSRDKRRFRSRSRDRRRSRSRSRDIRRSRSLSGDRRRSRSLSRDRRRSRSSSRERRRSSSCSRDTDRACRNRDRGDRGRERDGDRERERGRDRYRDEDRDRRPSSSRRSSSEAAVRDTHQYDRSRSYTTVPTKRERLTSTTSTTKKDGPSPVNVVNVSAAADKSKVSNVSTPQPASSVDTAKSSSAVPTPQPAEGLTLGSSAAKDADQSTRVSSVPNTTNSVSLAQPVEKPATLGGIPSSSAKGPNVSEKAKAVHAVPPPIINSGKSAGQEESSEAAFISVISSQASSASKHTDTVRPSTPHSISRQGSSSAPSSVPKPRVAPLQQASSMGSVSKPRIMPTTIGSITNSLPHTSAPLATSSTVSSSAEPPFGPAKRTYKDEGFLSDVIAKKAKISAVDQVVDQVFTGDLLPDANQESSSSTPTTTVALAGPNNDHYIIAIKNSESGSSGRFFCNLCAVTCSNEEDHRQSASHRSLLLNVSEPAIKAMLRQPYEYSRAIRGDVDRVSDIDVVNDVLIAAAEKIRPDFQSEAQKTLVDFRNKIFDLLKKGILDGAVPKCILIRPVGAMVKGTQITGKAQAILGVVPFAPSAATMKDMARYIAGQLQSEGTYNTNTCEIASDAVRFTVRQKGSGLSVSVIMCIGKLPSDSLEFNMLSDTELLKCKRFYAALVCTTWFAITTKQLQDVQLLQDVIRLLTVMRSHESTLAPVPLEAWEVIAVHVMRTGQVSSLAKSMRGVFSLAAAGLFLNGGMTLHYPHDRSMPAEDIGAHLTDQQRRDVTTTGQRILQQMVSGDKAWLHLLNVGN